MSAFYRQAHTKKPAALLGRGLAVGDGGAGAPVTVTLLLQLHSVFLWSRLLLGKAMNIPAAQ